MLLFFAITMMGITIGTIITSITVVVLVFYSYNYYCSDDYYSYHHYVWTTRGG